MRMRRKVSCRRWMKRCERWIPFSEVAKLVAVSAIQWVQLRKGQAVDQPPLVLEYWGIFFVSSHPTWLTIDMLMGEGHSLLSVASRMHPGIQTWADIAERVGARREDFDRVRHAASWMQQTLPQKKARGEF